MIAMGPYKGSVHMLPKYVKLSDSGIGTVVEVGSTVSNSKTWYPLDFNAAGYVIQQPPRVHIGNPHMVKTTDGPAFAQ